MRKHHPFHTLLTACALFGGTILAILNSASAATDTWTGGAGASPNNNWNNGANWQSGNAPSPYDSLIFTNQSGATKISTNDFTAGTAFDGITFGPSAAGSTMMLVGNSILLSGNTNNLIAIGTGITNTTSLAETVSNNLILDWGYHTFYSPAAGSVLNLNGSMLATNLGGVADFGTSNVNSSAYVLDGTGLIAGLGGAGLIGNSSTANGFKGLATVTSGGVVTNYTYSSSQTYIAAGAIGVDDTTTLTTGFANGATVTTVVVASAAGIQVGDVMTGTGVPAGAAVTGISGTMVSISFTATAASTGSYIFLSSATAPPQR